MSKSTLNIPDSLTNLTNIDYQILDAIEASIYWKDLNGRYLGANKYMLRMSGMTREKLIGSTDYLLPWKNEANKLQEVDKLVIDTQKRYEFEEMITIINGMKKFFLSSKSPLFDTKNNVIGVIGVSVDITHNKKFENEFAKTEKSLNEYSSIKTRFLKNISHEARIPMGSVMSISESLHSNWDKFDDKLKKENIDLIFKESKRLSQFILNTFDMSNFVKGEVQPSFSKNNLSQLVKKIVEKYKGSFCEEKVSLTVADSEDYTLAFDKKLITQVIENLLMNAVQYSPKKKKITITLHKSHLKDGAIPAVHCCITDEGIGIPEAELQSIFDPFTESSATASKAYGVGLGLSICKEIIELHSGKIWAENNSLKKGATFNFCIPTTLFAFSSGCHNDLEEQSSDPDNISYRRLTKFYPEDKKKSFGLVAVSPFNSYFSSEKILEICEWTKNYYDDFAIFFPDKISKYNLEALGYEDSKIHQKIRKQDGHAMNRINKALSMFYEKNKNKSEIQIYAISTLKENSHYQSLYQNCLKLFYNNKEFRECCTDTAKSYLMNHFNKNNITKNSFEESLAVHSAVQYFLFELPVMTSMNDILGIESCDYIYHNISDSIKQIANNKNVMSKNQGFLVLK
ncbi:MAG TPA: tRNA-dependent cyclodipeptide synthase [Candidatus Megaira endosymbiont of Nemacystus decipiens]|nr:tRNA-dependent cyclodipeptide synthase [Candidatus Megaera endosymbiont of Nemacystus decipiens]